MKNLFASLYSKFRLKKDVTSHSSSSPQNKQPELQTKHNASFYTKIANQHGIFRVVFILLACLVLLVIAILFIRSATEILQSPLLLTKFLIVLLGLFIIVVLMYFLRRAWPSESIARLKSKLPILHRHAQHQFKTVNTYVTLWIQRFKHASQRERWAMIRNPLCVLLALFLLIQFGPLFIPPKILTSFPGNKSLEAPLDSKIEVIFNKGVIKSSAEHSFSITPTIQGKFSWESNQKLIFTPSNALERGKDYKVAFKGVVFSSYLIPLLGNNSITFETIGNPKVVVASPMQEAIEDLTPITVVFDRQMIPLTTATNSAERLPAFTISPNIHGDGKWLGTTAYQFRPTESFKKGTTYTVTIPASIQSQDGGKLGSTYTWQFSSQRPHINAVTPLSGYDFASPVASIAATFNQNINPASIPNKFTVYDKNRNKVPGSVIVNRNMVGFYPSTPLGREQQYEVIISAGVAGTEGPNGMEDDYSWFFTVAASPGVISTNPTNDSKNIDQQYQITALFKTPMDEDSFKGNVTINPAPSSDPSLSFSSYNNQNSLSIDTYLGRSIQYTIIIGANVKDQYGVPLGSPYSFTFLTAPYKPSMSIYPDGTYFGAFNQQVTQRIVAQVINTNHIDYALYKLNKTDVLDLYRRHYEQQCGQDSACRGWQTYDTSKLTKVNSWSQDFQTDKDTPTQVVTKVTMSDGTNLPSGFYFLDLKIPEGPHDNMVMIVSKSTLTVKKSDSQVFIWAVNQSSGDTISNMNVQLMDDSGNALAQGTTNADGVFMKDVNLFQKDNLFVLGQNGDDAVLAASAWNQGIDIYDFGLPTYYSANEQKDYNTQQSFKTYLVLDRPIYRPGQIVYFKGVIRKDNDGAYENLPPGANVAVTITDAMNRSVYSQSMPITTFGSFAGNFTLGKNANLGNYQIGSSYEGNSANQAFQVEEYKKPDLLVTVNPNKTNYVQGETADILMNAAYYFGAPVTDTPISYTVETQDYAFQWSKDWRFEFGDPDAYWDRPWWYYTGSGYSDQTLVTQGTGTTDSKGNFDIHLPIDISKQTASQQMVIEATVTDVNNQAIASSQTITANKAALYAGLHPSNYENEAGNSASVDIVTVDDKGIEVPNTPVSVSFYKRTWETVRELNPDDGNFYYTSKPSDSLITTTAVSTDAQGHGTASFTPTDGGTYKAVVTVTDKNGNQNTSGSFLWVAGSGFQAPRENNDRIVLTTDKPDYFVGDTLSVFVATPFASASAKTLLTAERGSVLDYKIVDTSDASNNFTMAVSTKYSPNAFIGAVLVKPGSKVTDPAEFKIGYTPIQVTDKKQQIVVSISTDSKRYKPKDTLHATIETKDASGNPVSAEVAVGLVDKAVWDLAEVQLPDIYKVFYEPRSLSVTTSQLLTISIDRINANLNLGAKGGSGGGCFTGDTPVLMKGGIYKNIQDINTGDIVLTKKSDTSPNLIESKVLQTFKHVVDRYLIINGTLKVTPIHKIFVNSRWTVAGTIIPGDYLLDQHNHPVKVFSVEQVMGTFTVYNLETENYHTYFAGDVYVHNEKGGFDTSRSNFPDTAYWNPYVKTDNNGQAQITIPLPDNLTTWRLAAIANSSQAAFGQNVTEVVVGRDVLIRPFLPRFLSVGDQAKLGAIVVNTSGRDQTITAKIEGDGIQITDNATKQQSIADGAEAKITWSTVTQNVSSANIKLSVIGDNNSTLDSVVTTLPVKSYSVPEVVATAGQAKDTAQENILLPLDVDKTQGEATLTYSPSLGSASIDSLSYLFSYPYNCIEQVTSKFMPAVFVNRIFKNSNISSDGEIEQSQLQSIITDNIQTLNSQQHSDGGWGWFTEYDSDPYITAYALSGLLEAKKDGFTVSSQTIQNARNYLMSQLAYSGNTIDINVQAYILYVLSDNDKGLSSYATNLFERRFELSLEARAYLAISMKNISGMSANASKLYDELLSLAKLTSTTAHWEENDKDYHLLGSNTTATATMLEALVDFDKGNPLIPEVIRYLMNIRTDGHWASTRDTAGVIKAISNQLLSSNDQSVNEHYKITLGGKTLQEGAFAKQDLLKVMQYIIPVQKLTIGSKNLLAITKSGDGNLYYNMNLKYFLPFSTINSLDQGVVIAREFVDSKGNELPTNSIDEGSEVWVRLIIVAPAERHFVTIEDVLPAGLESVNESLKNVSVLNKKAPPLQNKADNLLYFNHKEYHDDRTTLFANDLPAGVYEVSYRVRATTPGLYHYPPAQAYELYSPDVSGHSDGGWLEVRPQP